MLATGIGLFIILCALLPPPPDSARRKLTAEEITYDRIDALAEECERYRKVIGAWPTSIISILLSIPIKDTNIMLDAWGREFAIRAFTNAPREIYVISYGADGQPGGHGSNGDIIAHLK